VPGGNYPCDVPQRRSTSPSLPHADRPIDISGIDPYRNDSSMRGNTFRPFGGNRIAVMSGDDTRHDADCFSDEVVIDFPSVPPAVDRVRSSFLVGERSEALRATIDVTPRKRSRAPRCRSKFRSGARAPAVGAAARVGRSPARDAPGPGRNSLRISSG